ncbi:hypothetical protein BH23BAC1_BH23BAC1_31160 [soil metagenome]
MKKTYNFFVLVFISGLILFSGCKKNDDDPGISDEQRQIERLAHTWVPGTITFEGAPAPGFQNFTITFNTGNSYTAQNGYPVFKNSGSWAFKQEGGNINVQTIVLDNNPALELRITSLTETNFNSNITLSGSANARTMGLDGTYAFNLVRQ